MNKTRLIQIVARYLGVGMSAAAVWMWRHGVSPTSQPDVTTVAEPLAAFIVAALLFIGDHLLHAIGIQDALAVMAVKEKAKKEHAHKAIPPVTKLLLLFPLMLFGVGCQATDSQLTWWSNGANCCEQDDTTKYLEESKPSKATATQPASVVSAKPVGMRPQRRAALAEAAKMDAEAMQPHYETTCGVCALGLCALGADVTYNNPWTGGKK
jgi:hypothetical protein